MPPDPHRGSAPGPRWGASVPKMPWFAPNPCSLATPLVNCDQSSVATKVVVHAFINSRLYSGNATASLTTWCCQSRTLPLGWWQTLSDVTTSHQFFASCPGFQCGNALSSRSSPWSTSRCLGMPPTAWLTIAASSPTLAQEDCARLRLARFSSVRCGPTSATEPSVQLELSAHGRRTPELSYSRFRRSLKTFVVGQWDQSAVWTCLTVL